MWLKWIITAVIHRVMLFYFDLYLNNENQNVFNHFCHNYILATATDKSFPHNDVILWYQLLLALFIAWCHFWFAVTFEHGYKTLHVFCGFKNIIKMCCYAHMRSICKARNNEITFEMQINKLVMGDGNWIVNCNLSAMKWCQRVYCITVDDGRKLIMMRVAHGIKV